MWIVNIVNFDKPVPAAKFSFIMVGRSRNHIRSGSAIMADGSAYIAAGQTTIAYRLVHQTEAGIAALSSK